MVKQDLPSEFSMMSPKLRGYKSYGTFPIFLHQYIQGCRVTRLRMQKVLIPSICLAISTEAWVLRLWWATAWHSHFSSFTWKCKLWTKSTANSANPSAQEVENSDKRATTVTMFDKMLHWRMKLEGTNAKYWLRRNTSQQQQQIQLYCKPPERWPNWRMMVWRLQWNYMWWNFLSNWY